MHFQWLRANNVRHLPAAEWDFSDGYGALKRWTLLPTGASSAALLRCVALTGLGRQQMDSLAPRVIAGLAAYRDRPVEIEAVLVRHAPQERKPYSPVRRQIGWRLHPDGRVETLPRPANGASERKARFGRPELGSSHRGRLAIGYGSCVTPYIDTDDFGIYPDQRVKGIAGLFEASARVTDPIAFLERLRYKSCYRAGRARALLDRLTADLTDWLGWDVENSLSRLDEFARRWRATPASRRTPAIVLLDIARHSYDAAEHLLDPNPLLQPGIMLLMGPEAWCEAARLPRFLELLDLRFPNLLFIVTLSASARRRFPARLLRQRLPIPEAQPRPRAAAVRRLAPETVLLVDVDSTLPNLALMRLCRHYRSRGRKVVLARGVRSLPLAGTVLASCVFSTPGSAKRIVAVRRQCGSGVHLGGSGISGGSNPKPPATMF